MSDPKPAVLPRRGDLRLMRRTIMDAGQACIDWYEDTGMCHFCEPDPAHYADCPLRVLYDEGASDE